MLSVTQIVQILETPLGNYENYSDVEVVKHRKRIRRLYEELKPRSDSWRTASEQARVQWLLDAQQHGLVWC